MENENKAMKIAKDNHKTAFTWKRPEKEKIKLTELDFDTEKTEVVEGETQIYLTDEQLLLLAEQIPEWALKKALGCECEMIRGECNN